MPLKLTLTETVFYFLLQSVGFSWVSGFCFFLLNLPALGRREKKCTILTGLVSPHLSLKINPDND